MQAHTPPPHVTGHLDAEPRRPTTPASTVANTLHGHAGATVLAGTIAGDVHLGTNTQVFEPPPPAQLPPAPAVFIGRAGELDRLTQVMRRCEEAQAPAMAVISGPPGIGKTGLALWWSSRVADRFDGQLYARLGHSATQAPAAWLGRWLRALGVPPQCVPTDRHELVVLWRTVADHRLIIVVDDAVSAEQVMTLLPGAGSSIAVITTRNQLPGLASAGALIPLRPLDQEHAAELLQRLLDGGLAGRADDVARRCGGVPLTLAAIAGRLTLNRHLDLSDLVTGPDAALPLDQRAHNPVFTAYQISYAGLSIPAARLYRLMSLQAGPDFSAPAAAAALDIDTAQARVLLEEIHRAGLLTDRGPDRWGFHDLVRTHALAMADDECTGQERAAARYRVIGYYRDTALAARAAGAPYLTTADTAAGQLFCDRGQALAWLDAEHITLVATASWAHEHGLHEDAYRIVHGMWPLYLHYRPADWIDTDQLGLAAARRTGDAAAEAEMLDRLGAAFEYAGDDDEALAHFTDAQSIWQGRGDEHKIAGSLRRLGGIAARQSRFGAAVGQLTEAADGHLVLGETREAALALTALGDALTRSGEPDQALIPLREAIEMLDGLRGDPREDPYNRARAEAVLGNALIVIGEFTLAEEHLGHAAVEMRRLGSLYAEADILEALSRLSEHRADPNQARAYSDQAAELRRGRFPRHDGGPAPSPSRHPAPPTEECSDEHR